MLFLVGNEPLIPFISYALFVTVQVTPPLTDLANPAKSSTFAAAVFGAAQTTYTSPLGPTLASHPCE